jgi:hypothetical protein
MLHRLFAQSIGSKSVGKFLKRLRQDFAILSRNSAILGLACEIDSISEVMILSSCKNARQSNG